MTKFKLGTTVYKKFVDFALWLPDATAVTLILDNADFSAQEFTMTVTDDDIWTLRLEEAKVGMAYQYRAQSNDGTIKIFSDPRAHQLSSADGKGIIADTTFDWGSDDDFVLPSTNEQVIYELHIGTFNQPDQATPGTFLTAIEKLDYLQNLGINMIEILPVTAMLDGFGWGYAPIGLFAVEENYGGPHGLKEFVKAAHQRGMGVIIDIVYNHMHPYCNLPEAYFFTDGLRDTPWGPRLNYTRPEVQEYMTDNIAMWLSDYHADGMRLDFTVGVRQIDMSYDDPQHEIPGGWQILQSLTRVAHHTKPHARIIAEDNGANNYLTKNIRAGGAGFDAQWNVEWPRALDVALGTTGGAGNFGELINEMNRYYNGDFLEKIVYAESHDTAALANGNRRIARDFNSENPAAPNARAMTILAGALALTAPGAPMLFQGQEMVSRDGWSAQDPLDWRDAEKFSGIVEAHKHLIALRRNIFGGTGGLSENSWYEVLRDETYKVLVYQRGDAEPVVVIANFSGAKISNYRFPQLANIACQPDKEGQLCNEQEWMVRFNSSWKGYSTDTAEVKIDTIKAGDEIDLPPYVVLILTKV